MTRLIHHARILPRLLLLSCCCILFTGCVERIMQVRSEPAGALVRVDGKPVGRTPVDVPFTHYGNRLVTLELDEYQMSRQLVHLETPWHLTFPLDIVFDVAFPITFLDYHPVEVTLERQETLPDRDEILDRAERMRDVFEDEKKRALEENE
jgi:hypothetical protein